MSSSGVFRTNKKDGSVYFRASITYKDKHISLGSFDTEEAAGAAYCFAKDYLGGERECLPDEYEKVLKSIIDKDPGGVISFDKWIMLLNLKKTGMYCKNPIYLYGNYFVYYLDRNTELKFDADELFFFRNHKLQRRGGHIFYSDYGMQCGLLSRFGVKNFAICGRDYVFKNGDELDFRFGNLEIINKYYGVSEKIILGRKKFFVKIHFRSDLKVGCYDDEIVAAVSYNKAADSLEEAVRRKINAEREHTHDTAVENKMLGFNAEKDTNSGNPGIGKNMTLYDTSRKNRYRKWKRNYVEKLSKSDYIRIYSSVAFSKSFKNFLNKM